MKKFLSKINRGLILFFALVIGLSVYLVALEVSRAGEKEEIRSVCLTYLEDFCDWVPLPEEHRFPGPGTGPSAYLSSIRDEVGENLYESEDALSFELDRLMTMYETQRSVGSYIRSVDKVVQFGPTISYADDTVYVQVQTLTTVDYDVMSDSSVKSESWQSTDTFALKKQNGEWKIYFSQLDIPIW